MGVELGGGGWAHPAPAGLGTISPAWSRDWLGWGGLRLGGRAVCLVPPTMVPWAVAYRAHP